MTPYFRIFTGGWKSCPKGWHYEPNNDIKKGTCCEDDKFLSVDKPSRAMGCCPKGEPPHKLFVDPNNKALSCCPSNALGFIGGGCVFPDPPQSSSNPCLTPEPESHPQPHPHPRLKPQPP